jgi:hypothetical protein
MTARPRKRSLTLRGHRTSVSMEDAFWDEFRRIADARGQSVNELAAAHRNLVFSTCAPIRRAYSIEAPVLILDLP